jgi:glucokinase
MSENVLAGDVGGTKTNLAIFRAENGELSKLREQRYVTRDHPSLESVCQDFIGASSDIQAACLGVPGPVIDGCAHATNVDWEMSEAAVSRAIRGKPARLINDLGATAYGMLYLKPAEVAMIHRSEAASSNGNIAVIAPGTGLGESALIYADGAYRLMASEGGHTDFAPVSDEQVDLLGFLHAEFGHVSYERVLSGPGIYNLYRFKRSRSLTAEPDWLANEIAGTDPAAAVTQAAMSGRDEVCAGALSMFCEILGAEAANLALKVLAFGGVFIGGGIAPRVVPALSGAAFMRGYLAKGRLVPLLRRMDVKICLNSEAALIGAAHSAAAML